MASLQQVAQWVAVQAFFVWALTEQYVHMAWCWLVERYPSVFAEKTTVIWCKEGEVVQEKELNGVPLSALTWPTADDYDLMVAKVPVPINPAVITPTLTHFIVRPVNELDLCSVLIVPKVAKGVRFYQVSVTVKQKGAENDEHATEKFIIPVEKMQLAVVNNKLFDLPFALWLLSSTMHRDVNLEKETVSVTFIDNTFQAVPVPEGACVIVNDADYRIVTIKTEKSVFVGQ
jgi:hypothetical protein